MLEYLYNLLVNVDRCNVTPIELRNYIAQNEKVIKTLKNPTSYFNQYGGNGDEIEEKVRLYLEERKLEKVRDVDNTAEKEEIMRQNMETIEVAGIMANFLGELSKMVDSKKPEYATIESQVGQIREELESYIINNADIADNRDNGDNGDNGDRPEEAEADTGKEKADDSPKADED